MTNARTYSEMIGETGPLGVAIIRAINEVNAEALAVEAMAEAQRIGDRWAAIFAAEAAAGEHAVVLPVALAEDVLALTRGGEPRLAADLVVTLLAAALAKVSK